MIGRLVVLLLAANLAWFAWSQGWLRGVGMGPTVQTEPERLERQVRPEALEVKPLPGTPSTGGSSTAPAPVASAPAAAPPPAVSGAPASTEPPPAPVTAAALSTGFQVACNTDVSSGVNRPGMSGDFLV